VLETFFKTAPNDAEWLPIKAIAVVALHGLLRLNEIVAVQFEDITLTGTLEGNNRVVSVRVFRQKQHGPKTEDHFQIFETTCLEVIDNYLKCFPNSVERKGRFFRKVDPKTMLAFNRPLGEKTVAKASLAIAKFLNLQNPGGYTSHSFRTSTATIMADSGASSVQIQNAANWSSQTTAVGFFYFIFYLKIFIQIIYTVLY
jgi:hypothetical protein